MENFVKNSIQNIIKEKDSEKSKLTNEFVESFCKKYKKNFDLTDYNNEYLFKNYGCQIVFFDGEYQFLQYMENSKDV